MTISILQLQKLQKEQELQELQKLQPCVKINICHDYIFHIGLGLIKIPYNYYCRYTHSSLHISSHHCTFCASLHVKISPAYLIEIGLLREIEEKPG